MELEVEDIDRSVDFYRGALGLVPSRASTGEVVMGLDSVGLLLRCSRPSRPLSIWFALPQWQMRRACMGLKDLGVEVTGPRDQEGIRQVASFTDPDGHVIRLVCEGGPEVLEETAPRRPVRPGGPHREEMWAGLYSDNAIESMPWFSRELDGELMDLLPSKAPLPGRFIELGCGGGTASARLAALGYQVVGVDIAQGAVDYAKRRFEGFGPGLSFRQGDVLAPLEGLGLFDYAFDRGCFHTLPPERREVYASNLAAVLRRGGRAFIKVFSRDEPGQWGPHRFAPGEVARELSNYFELEEELEASFVGQLVSHPKGLLSVLVRK